ncbi:hypothetical protein ABG067_003072 [Albugo candida]
MGDENLTPVDVIIRKLLAVRDKPQTEVRNLTNEELMFLCRETRSIFLDEPMLIEAPAPINICGDTHGQYADLLRLFEMGGSPSEQDYIFLGDYVDRAMQSIETICLLFAYKIKFPSRMYLLRGNHECASINRIYGQHAVCTVDAT